MLSTPIAGRRRCFSGDATNKDGNKDGGFKHEFYFPFPKMGCHPKPIDFHSIIFRDGYCTTNQRLPLFRRNRWPEAAPATAATAAEVVGMGKRGCSAGAY